jgi:hypothetical protein
MGYRHTDALLEVRGMSFYKFKGHWEGAPTIIPAEEGET